jgi:hypothetical protein
VASFKSSNNNNTDAGPTTCGDEPVTVGQVGPSIKTTPNPASGTVGTTLNDSATLSGGSSPTGKITFNLYSPSASSCTGTPAYTQDVTVSGNGNYSTSPGFAANAVGTWRWTATYSGDTNNKSASSGCSDEQVTITNPNNSQITPTQTTCSQFSNGTATTLPSLNYTVKSGKVFNVTPGVFFYWVKVTATAGSNTFTIKQNITTGNFNSFFVDAAGSNVFNAGCNALQSKPQISTSGGVTTVKFTASSAGTYIIGIKYDSKSIVNATAPTKGSNNDYSVHYDFSTTGVSGSTQGLDLKKQ